MTESEVVCSRERGRALMQRSRETRAHAVELRAKAVTTKRSVVGLLDQAKAIQAALLLSKSAASPGLPVPASAFPWSGFLGAIAVLPTPDLMLQALTGVQLDQGDLDDLIDELVAAYKEAQGWGDEKACALLGRALTLIGHNIARRLGPKAAGVVLN